MAKTGGKRGRPRRDASAVTQSGIVQTLRNDLNDIIGVCETCHRPLRSVAPIAEQAGVSAIVLAGFIRGHKGLSMETLDKVWAFVADYKANPEKYALNGSGEAEATTELATA